MGCPEDLQACQDANAQLVIDLDAANAQIAPLTASLATLTADLATANAEIATLTADLATANAEIATLTADLATANAEIATLTRQLAECEHPTPPSDVFAEFTLGQVAYEVVRKKIKRGGEVITAAEIASNAELHTELIEIGATCIRLKEV